LLTASRSWGAAFGELRVLKLFVFGWQRFNFYCGFIKTPVADAAL
jgi:hypothetical protein